MTLIRCRKSTSVQPYVVVATDMVKDCPVHRTTPLADCRKCEYYIGERA